MRTIATTLLTVAAVAMVGSSAMSQPRGGPGRRGGPGERGSGGPDGPPPNPIVEALDVDGDHEITAKEIDNAATVLKTLDRNGDGKLTHEEIHPFGRPGGGDRGGPRGGEVRGRRRPHGEDGAGNATAFVDRILSFDKNKDGKVGKSELPERMQRILDRHDANKDGVLDEPELAQIVSQSGQGRELGSSRGPDARGGSGGPDGPPNPETFVDDAMAFDANQDGELNRAELMTMAEEFAQRGPPGRGRERRGGFGGRRGRPGGDGGERPRRPARSEFE